MSNKQTAIKSIKSLSATLSSSHPTNLSLLKRFVYAYVLDLSSRFLSKTVLRVIQWNLSAKMSINRPCPRILEPDLILTLLKKKRFYLKKKHKILSIYWKKKHWNFYTFCAKLQLHVKILKFGHIYLDFS